MNMLTISGLGGMRDQLTCAVRFLRRAAEHQPTGMQHATTHLALGAASIALGHESGTPANECERTRTRLALSIMFPEIPEAAERLRQERDEARAHVEALRHRITELTHLVDNTGADPEPDRELAGAETRFLPDGSE
jgi:hypothetical protein